MQRKSGFILLSSVLIFSRLTTAGTVYGPSGLILYPSAAVGQQKGVAFGASTFNVKPAAGGTQSWTSITGALSLSSRLEAGVTYLRRSGGGTLDGVGAFGKWQLRPEGLALPAVSAGANVIGGDLRTQEYYLVASKQILPKATRHPLTLTGGLMQVDYRDGLKRSGLDFFGGADLALSGKFSLVAEYRTRTRFNVRDSSGAMVMYRGKNYGVGVGFVNNGNSDSHQFFIGAGFGVGTLD